MSESKYDAVLSYHLNPLTCGVAKFNHELARRLGVPCDSLKYQAMYGYPLISIKPSEIDMPVWAFDELGPYDLLLHDRSLRLNSPWIESAADVFYADEVGCPATLHGHTLRYGYLHVLTFGMAHKRTMGHFQKLKQLLDDTKQTYTVGVSSAIHEGSPWEATWAESDRMLRDIFGDHLRQYGFLADDGLVSAMKDADAVALFYDPAVRANNTTLWAALEQRIKIVLTNLDAESPAELTHGNIVYDIQRLERWPWFSAERWPMVSAGQVLANGRYGWDRLLQRLAVPAAVSMIR